MAQIAVTEWTRDGRLRHPRYLGLRDDKPAREVVGSGRPEHRDALDPISLEELDLRCFRDPRGRGPSPTEGVDDGVRRSFHLLVTRKLG